MAINKRNRQTLLEVITTQEEEMMANVPIDQDAQPDPIFECVNLTQKLEDVDLVDLTEPDFEPIEESCEPFTDTKQEDSDDESEENSQTHYGRYRKDSWTMKNHRFTHRDTSEDYVCSEQSDCSSEWSLETFTEEELGELRNEAREMALTAIMTKDTMEYFYPELTEEQLEKHQEDIRKRMKVE